MWGRKGKETLLAQARYNRIAPVYDLMEWWTERTARKWRRLLWDRVGEGRGLEVGLGTGKNLSYHPAGSELVGVDLSPKMLSHAIRRAVDIQSGIDLILMDAQSLAFADNSFDWAVATFIFCSVPDPIAGLEELRRVCKPDGRIFLLEHVRSDNLVLGKVMDSLNPLAVRLTGANINRNTVDNVRRAGLDIFSVEEMGMGGIIKLITARPARP